MQPRGILISSIKDQTELKSILDSLLQAFERDCPEYGEREFLEQVQAYLDRLYFDRIMQILITRLQDLNIHDIGQVKRLVNERLSASEGACAESGLSEAAVLPSGPVSERRGQKASPTKKWGESGRPKKV